MQTLMQTVSIFSVVSKYGDIYKCILSFFCLSDCFLSKQDPNQLIRGSALRVLSSIRVPVIAPIMMLAIKEVSSNRYMVIIILTKDVA